MERFLKIVPPGALDDHDESDAFYDNILDV